jgi:2-oxo-4-hydroxy-4-carboxy-5-ureidoimidazoline decarboxylase
LFARTVLLTPGGLSLINLNDCDRDAFVARLGDVVEHSPWVAREAFGRRPFGSVDALWRAMMDCIREAPRSTQEALIRLHPELGGAEASAGNMTASSTGEQGRLGLASLSAGEFVRLGDLNRLYRDRFGYPCIIALRLHQDRESVMRTMERRLTNDAETERRVSVDEIGEIVLGRLERLCHGN